MPTPSRRLSILPILALAALGCAQPPPDTLAIGAPAPAFSLPGVDGAVHRLEEYAGAAVLAVVFTCNHCPASQLYEQRIQQLYREYRDRSVAVVAINPSSDRTVTARDLAFSDVPESLAGMAERVRYRGLEFPYLYDGEAQAATAAFKVVATPQIYIFDKQRTLRYVGRIDDSLDAGRVKTRDARAAIDALLSGQSVAEPSTPVVGCPVTRIADAERRADAPSPASPVTVTSAGPSELQALRKNLGGKVTLVNFWATWCGPCISEFPDLQRVHRDYRSRGLDYVTISIDVPDARPNVMALLQQHQASSRNYIFATDDIAGLQEAFDPALPASVPFTMVLAPNGDVLHQQHGEAQFLELRRAILASLPDDPKYPGQQQYWAE